MSKPNVTIMGLGYIGLPTAILIAQNEIYVHGVDISLSVVEIINRGEIHIIEPGLELLAKKVVKGGFLRADLQPAKADVFVIVVPTPFTSGHKPDISYVESATKMVIPYLSEGNLFIIESTSPVGTTEKIAQLIFSERPELKNKIFVAYCPERVLPGNIIYELENNDRVIGGIDDMSSEKAMDFYKNFVKGNLYKTNAKTAEMCKLAENSYRDVNIAFANELSLICDKAGINVNELIKFTNKHPRVKILKPGVGVGGHCIAVDPWFIVSEFKDEARIIRTAREVNDHKSEWVINKIKVSAFEFEKQFKRKPIIACMGLSFKPDIDDLRESPALRITSDLIKNNFHVLAVEPNIKNHVDIKLIDYRQAIETADLIVFLVSHKEFIGLKIMDEKIVLDYCGINESL